MRLIEPASILILGGDQDKWSRGIESLVEYARSAFHKGVLDFGVFPGGQQFSQSMRERAYAFLAKHLES